MRLVVDLNIGSAEIAERRKLFEFIKPITLRIDTIKKIII
jgi:hypothetical protein